MEPTPSFPIKQQDRHSVKWSGFRVARAFIVSLIVLLPSLLPVVAKAASAYDNSYRNINQLYIHSIQNGCGTFDSSAINITPNWNTLLHTEENYLGNSQYTTIVNSLDTALAGGTWGLSYFHNTSYPGQDYAVVYWTESATNTSINFSTSDVSINTTNGQTLHSIIIRNRQDYLQTGSNCAKVAIVQYNATTDGSGELSNAANTSTVDVFNLFYAGLHIDYPTGYAGTLIPTITDVASNDIAIVTVQVDGNTAKFVYEHTLRYTPISNVNLHYLLTIRDSHDNGNVVDEKDVAATDTYIKSGLSNGNYNIDVLPQLIDTSLPTSSLHPFAHTSLNFVVDGSVHTYSMTNCDSNGTCSAPSEYQDCSTMSIINAIGCHITNAFTRLKNLLVSMFVPNGDDIKNRVDDFNGKMQSKLGFLVYPFTFINGLFTAFTNSTDTWCNDTTCKKDFGTFMGSHVTFDFYAAKEANASLWTLVTTMFRAITVVALIFAVRRKYLSIVTK